MIYTREEKAELNKRLAGVKGKGAVFNAINEGKSRDEVEAIIADLLNSQPAPKQVITLNRDPSPLQVFGKHLVAKNTVDDLTLIARLPYVTNAALMPDGHRTGEGSV